MARTLSKVCCGLALLSAAAAAAGCTGTISSPGSEATAAGPTGTSTPGGGGSAGVTATPERTTPDGVGWATRFPKLSNEQWENTVIDLFYLETATGLSESFLPEPADGGYTNEAAATVTIAGDFWTRYQIAAEGVAELVAGSAQNLDKLVPPGAPSTLPEKARSTIEKLGRRAYRRPLSVVELEGYVTLYNAGAALDQADGFGGGMRLVIQTLLQSPYFLYRVEGS